MQHHIWWASLELWEFAGIKQFSAQVKPFYGLLSPVYDAFELEDYQ